MRTQLIAIAYTFGVQSPRLGPRVQVWGYPGKHCTHPAGKRSRCNICPTSSVSAPPTKSRMLEARSAGKCNKLGFEVRIQFSTHRLYLLTMLKHVVLATVRFLSPPATTTTTHDWKSWYTQVSPDAELHVAGLGVCDDGSQYGSALWAGKEAELQNQQDRFVSNCPSGRGISIIV
jgi:hypothetical protein